MERSIALSGRKYCINGRISNSESSSHSNRKRFAKKFTLERRRYQLGNGGIPAFIWSHRSGQSAGELFRKFILYCAEVTLKKNVMIFQR